MTSSTISRITVGALAVALTGSVGWGLHQDAEADAARAQLAQWQLEQGVAGVAFEMDEDAQPRVRPDAAREPESRES